ncbi:AfsR family transcriptional regulator [Streptomyces maremycinicus]|nr:AfsR family transcriptional regulator [Streptomyces sp. B9173]
MDEVTRFEVLGPVRVWRGDGELDPGFPQQRALLALLLAHAGRFVPTGEIVDVLWAQRPPASARNVVRRYAGALRRLLEPGLPPRAPGRRLPRRTGGYLLEAETDEADLLRFREPTRQGKRAAATGRAETAARQFVRALEEWRGPVAMGIPASARAHAQFTAVQGELLETARLAADAALLCGRAEDALPALRRATAHDPLDEPLHARLVLVLAACGLQAEALGAYDDVRRRLARDLGLAPGTELAAAHTRVLRQDVVHPLRSGPVVHLGRPIPTTRRTPSPHPPTPTPATPLRPIPAPVAPATPGTTPPGATAPVITAPEAVARGATGTGAPRPEAPGAHRTGDDTAVHHTGDTTVRRVGVGAVRPARLPSAPACFVGRAVESEWLAGAARPGGIVLVGGMPGVGKTALALHWAHRATDRFPDGQLFVALHGSGPAGPARSAVEPAEALRGMLAALGVPASRMPDGVDALTGLYRTLLARRRVLVVLDDAVGTGQLSPLLPTGPGCLALVTSRHALPGLVASGARPLRLAPPSAEDASAMLAGLLGEERTAAAPRAAEEIVARCGRLPLALTTVAARAVGRPDLPLAAEAAALRAADGGLDALDAVREALLGSYRLLAPDSARLFRLLPRHAGPDITPAGAAALAGLTVRRARLLLAALADAHVLDEPAPGRYALHDLLRVFALERAATESPPHGP